MNVPHPIKLTIQSGSACHRLAVAAGTSVRDALDSTDLRVRAACGGSGSCGACVVRLLGGEVNPHTTSEYQKLTAEEREQGLRLACQLRIKGDAEIRLDDPAPPSRWKSIPAENLAPVTGRIEELERHIYGVAVDLGTTHIRVALWDRKRGRRIATRRGLNPQEVFGADVLNRLDAALARPERAREISRLASDAIVQAVRDILARDVGEVTPMLAEIGHVMVVGNTAMLALLTGHGINALLAPDNWQRAIDCRPSDAAAWITQWPMAHAEITLPAPVAGFIGSDAVAAVIATHLADDPPGSMLLDVGTNTEIALWDGQRLHLTSVPGGPAFEGVGIRHGMSAETGAISGVTCHGAAGGFACEVIGGGAARGFCGSGLNDAVAVLLEAGIVKPSGRFALSPGAEGYALLPGNPHSAITGADVDAFQRAKAATAAAMETLLDIAGMGWRDIRRLCVCGAFGRHLHIGHAQAVGLLPAIANIELYADAALAGCEQALLARDGEQQFFQVTNAAEPVNLSYTEGYEDRYIDHLRLKPI